MKTLFIIPLIILTIHLQAQNRPAPYEEGDTGTIINLKTGTHHDFTILKNSPYSLNKTGFDFKGDMLCAKHSIVDVGVQYFKRPDLFHEFRAGVSCIVLLQDDSIQKPNSLIINSGRMIYSAEARYTWFNKGHIKKEETSFDEVTKSEDTYHDRKTGEQYIAKVFKQSGISFGVQTLMGYKHATTMHSISETIENGQSRTVQQIQHYTLPFASTVLSVGYERRRYEHTVYQIEGNRRPLRNEFVLGGSYMRLYYAPILYGHYIDANMQIQNQFPSFANHIGFGVGGYMDVSGLMASIEAGIMPGLGYYLKVGVPVSGGFALYHSKARVDGSYMKNGKWWD